jgi:hypothetical protein
MPSPTSNAPAAPRNEAFRLRLALTRLRIVKLAKSSVRMAGSDKDGTLRLSFEPAPAFDLTRDGDLEPFTTNFLLLNKIDVNLEKWRRAGPAAET